MKTKGLVRWYIKNAWSKRYMAIIDPCKWKRAACVVLIYSVVLSFVAASFVGCKAKTIVVPERKDSVRMEYRLDSVYLYERDSVYVDRFVKADTVYLTKTEWKTHYKDVERVVRDTITIERVNTIVQEVERPKSGWDVFTTWFTVIVLVLIALAVGYRIVVEVLNRKARIL